MIIVVARYDEDIQWTNRYPKVIIYNKGTKLEVKGYNEILLENVGREGHTYYKYIYDNYHKLDDYTIFLQGNPFDHSPNIVQILKEYIFNTKPLNDFEFISETVYDCKLSGCIHHKDLPLAETYEKLFDVKLQPKHLEYTFKFGAGAQFIVSKKLILKKPRDFYLKLVNMLNYDINPPEGYVIERFHKLIFS